VAEWNRLSGDERFKFCLLTGALPAVPGVPGKGKDKCDRDRSKTDRKESAKKKCKDKGKKKKRSKKGWTCYTRFYTEKLDKDQIKLSPVS